MTWTANAEQLFQQLNSAVAKLLGANKPFSRLLGIRKRRRMYKLDVIHKTVSRARKPSFHRSINLRISYRRRRRALQNAGLLCADTLSTRVRQGPFRLCRRTRPEAILRLQAGINAGEGGEQYQLL